MTTLRAVPRPPTDAPPPPDDDADNAAAPDDAATGDNGRPSIATKLVRLAESRYRLGITSDGDTIAVPITGPLRHVAQLLRSGMPGSLRNALAADYFDAEGKTATQAALTDALNVLQGRAERLTPEPVHLRTARHGESIWLDVGDAEGTALEVTPAGWRFATADDGIPVLFRRTELTAPLPLPRMGGTLDQLFGLLNIAPEDRTTLTAWLIAAYVPDIPHPILTLAGEQGTGKSSTAKLLAQLVDPSPVPLRKPPRDPDSFVTQLAGSWLAPLDNLSQVPDWLSDALCRAVTGDGDVRRKLYTDNALGVYAFQRCIILTGIDFAGLRGDLTERMLMVNLHRIDPTRRREDRALAADWESVRRDVLGALLTLLTKTLRALPAVKLDRAPRMADFARIVAALDDINGTEGLARYSAQSAEIAADTLTAHPFIARLSALPLDFLGTAAELLALVTPVEPEWRAPRGWPKNARAVTTALKRHAPALRSQGWQVDDAGEDRTHSRRWMIAAPDSHRETLLDDPDEQTTTQERR